MLQGEGGNLFRVEGQCNDIKQMTVTLSHFNMGKLLVWFVYLNSNKPFWIHWYKSTYTK